MHKLHTHYDHLKVARDAPASVIKAAYRTLSQEYHPDRSQDPDAARIMTMLNVAYAVLSDEVQRRDYDNWIAAEEATLPARPETTPRDTPPASTEPRSYRSGSAATSALQTIPARLWVLAALVLAYLAWIGLDRLLENKPFSFIGGSQGARAQASVVPAQITREQAIALLVSRLQLHRVADMACLLYRDEGNTPNNAKAERWNLALVEIHDKHCGGDPEIGHVRDRYIVSSSGNVFEYDAAEDAYHPY
jgi:hypothetical protein